MSKMFDDEPTGKSFGDMFGGEERKDAKSIFGDEPEAPASIFGDEPERPANVFGELDAPVVPDIFADDESERFCSRCRHYVRNAFDQKCMLAAKTVQATDTCGKFEPFA